MKADPATTWAAPAPVGGAAVQDAPPAGGSGRARTGKIARLPHALREAVNERLRDGLPRAEISCWLNSLPVVRDLLQKHFGGSPITEDNVSRWRQGGYAGWLENQENKEAMSIMAAGCRNIDQEDRDALAGQLSLGIAARMVGKLQKYDELAEGPLKEAAWRNLVWSLALLRRGEFYAGRLQLERDKLAPKKEEAEEPMCRQQLDEHFRDVFGLGGPHWNNFDKRWEGEGAAEMVEHEEVERMVLAEVRRRKAARAAQPPPHPTEPEQSNHDSTESLPTDGEVPPSEPAQSNHGSTESLPAEGETPPTGPAQPTQSNHGSTGHVEGGESRPAEGEARPTGPAQPPISIHYARLRAAAKRKPPPFPISE